MRMTVGPLPSAIYWRRRAVVLVGLLLLAFVPYAACTVLGDDAPRTDQAGGGASPEAPGVGGDLGPGAPPESPEPRPSAAASGTPGGTGPATHQATVAAPVPGGAPQAPGLRAPACADSDLSVQPVPARQQASAGVPLAIRLVVQNAATAMCARDVGADAQELRIVRGAETLWSSDHCVVSRPLPDVRSLHPGERLEYMVTWNGRSSTQGPKCAGGMPVGAMPAGAYEVIARVGSKLSAPVTLRVT